MIQRCGQKSVLLVLAWHGTNLAKQSVGRRRAKKGPVRVPTLPKPLFLSLVFLSWLPPPQGEIRV
jgi:hypothetical protein